MHILLTDALTCPRCGPEHGLILLADAIEERRVVSGKLGCPNCRTTFPIAGGGGTVPAFGGGPVPPVPTAGPASSGAVTGQTAW